MCGIWFHLRGKRIKLPDLSLFSSEKSRKTFSSEEANEKQACRCTCQTSFSFAQVEDYLQRRGPDAISSVHIDAQSHIELHSSFRAAQIDEQSDRDEFSIVFAGSVLQVNF